MATERKPISELYTGPTDVRTFGRRLEIIEGEFFGRFFFDRALSSVATKLPVGQEVNIVDVGSGQGAFIADAVTLRSLQQFRSLLYEQRQCLRVVGLTDSVSKEKHGTLAQYFPPAPNQRRPVETQGENYYYTITARQTLAHFLSLVGLERVHFFLASQSLIYFSAAQFQKTTETMIDSLVDGGQALIWGVGKRKGPLPAFGGVNATEFRHHGADSISQVINLLAEFPTNFSYYASLTLRPEWPAQKKVLKQFVKRLTYQGQVSAADPAQLANYWGTYLRYRRELPVFQMLTESGFYQTDPKEVKQALQLRLQLWPWFEAVKKRSYDKQFQAKQEYLGRLMTQPALEIKVLHQNDEDGIQAFVLTKKANKMGGGKD